MSKSRATKPVILVDGHKSFVSATDAKEGGGVGGV